MNYAHPYHDILRKRPFAGQPDKYRGDRERSPQYHDIHDIRSDTDLVSGGGVLNIVQQLARCVTTMDGGRV